MIALGTACSCHSLHNDIPFSTRPVAERASASDFDSPVQFGVTSPTIRSRETAP